MEIEKFKHNLKEAIDKTIGLAQSYVKEKLPKEFSVDLYEVDSKDTHSLNKKGRYNSLDEIIDKLYRSGSVPRWVDINVKSVEGDKTIIRCEYSNIFFENEDQLLHKEDGVPPFQILSPHIPPSHYDFDNNKVKDGKFSIKDVLMDD